MYSDDENYSFGENSDSEEWVVILPKAKSSSLMRGHHHHQRHQHRGGELKLNLRPTPMLRRRTSSSSENSLGSDGLLVESFPDCEMDATMRRLDRLEAESIALEKKREIIRRSVLKMKLHICTKERRVPKVRMPLSPIGLRERNEAYKGRRAMLMKTQTSMMRVALTRKGKTAGIPTHSTKKRSKGGSRARSSSRFMKARPRNVQQRSFGLR